MRVSDRLHHAADGEGQGGGLRGRDSSRPRRLALRAGAGAALLALGLIFAAPGLARAHSLLIESSPSANATLITPPRVLVLRFNNRIEKKLSRVRLVGGAGQRFDLPVAVDGPAGTLSATAPTLNPGPWRVEWQVLSTDGHVVSGAFSFRLGPDTAPAR